MKTFHNLDSIEGCLKTARIAMNAARELAEAPGAESDLDVKVGIHVVQGDLFRLLSKVKHLTKGHEEESGELVQEEAPE